MQSKIIIKYHTLLNTIINSVKLLSFKKSKQTDDYADALRMKESMKGKFISSDAFGKNDEMVILIRNFVCTSKKISYKIY